MATRYPQILTSILQDEAYPAARTFLGLSLHSLQKFYSHSTWVEQGNKGILEDLGLPGFLYDDLADAAEDVCSACASSQVQETSLVLYFPLLYSAFPRVTCQDRLETAARYFCDYLLP